MSGDGGRREKSALKREESATVTPSGNDVEAERVPQDPGGRGQRKFFVDTGGEAVVRDPRCIW